MDVDTLKELVDELVDKADDLETAYIDELPKLVEEIQEIAGEIHNEIND